MNRLIMPFIVLAGCAAWAAEPACVVELEEAVTRYTPGNNGAGPFWCYGSTILARIGDDVYASVIDAGKDVPPLCNTRWQLWHRDKAGWTLEQQEKDCRQREPCPLAVFHIGPLFLSVNPSTEPPGVKYGPCRPLVLEFDPARPASPPKTHEPAWAKDTSFTDHSYRGVAADGERGELLLLNIHSKTGAQYVSLRDRKGAWHERGKIEFPIRSCYPQVALRNGAAHVMAIGDIVEPNEEWRKLKADTLKQSWDYVFRRLFYTGTADIAASPFSAPIEVDSVEKTAGNISNLDLFIADDGAAHLLYVRRPHQYEFIRDRYFPGQPMTTDLVCAVVRKGTVAARRVLATTSSAPGNLNPTFARFHVGADGSLYVIASGSMADSAGKQISGVFLARMAGDAAPRFVPIGLKHGLGSFMTAALRAGTRPSDTIDLLGEEAGTIRYARLRLRR